MQFFDKLIQAILTSGIISIPFNDIPKPSGNYNIGTKSIELTDENRYEWFTEEKGDYRKIIVQLWYPTDSENGDVANYIDYGEYRINTLAEQFNYSPRLLRKLPKVKTNSIYNAEFHKDKFPLLIFSHGLGGNRAQNTIMIEELASHGYVVIAVEHAYDAHISIFNNGEIADYRSGINYESRNSRVITPKEFWDIRLPQIKTRASDVKFLLDMVEQKKFDKQFIDMIDLENIGLFGQSFGGATSIYSSFQDERVDACINLDGWMVAVPDNIIEQGINQDFIYLGQQEWDEKLNYEKLDKFIQSTKNSTKILIPGTTHYDYTDTPHMTRFAKTVDLAGDLPSEELKNLLNEVALIFFNTHLKQSDDSLDYLKLQDKYGISLIVDYDTGD